MRLLHTHTLTDSHDPLLFLFNTHLLLQLSSLAVESSLQAEVWNLTGGFEDACYVGVEGDQSLNTKHDTAKIKLTKCFIHLILQIYH